MKRKFPLAAVLRVRKVQEDTARAVVARAQAAERAAGADVSVRESALAARILPAVAGSPEFIALASARARLAQDLATSQMHHALARDEITVALGRWVAARGAVKGIETLEDRHQARVDAEDDRVAGQAADDLAATAWLRRRDAEAATS